MLAYRALSVLVQPTSGGVRRWPADTQLKRRRSVLFAFTFSPPA